MVDQQGKQSPRRQTFAQLRLRLRICRSIVLMPQAHRAASVPDNVQPGVSAGIWSDRERKGPRPASAPTPSLHSFIPSFHSLGTFARQMEGCPVPSLPTCQVSAHLRASPRLLVCLAARFISPGPARICFPGRVSEVTSCRNLLMTLLFGSIGFPLSVLPGPWASRHLGAVCNRMAPSSSPARLSSLGAGAVAYSAQTPHSLAQGWAESRHSANADLSVGVGRRVELMKKRYT